MKILRSCDQNHQVRPLSQLVVIREWEIFALGHQSWQKDDVAVDLWWCLTIFVQQEDRRVELNINIAFLIRAVAVGEDKVLKRKVYLISEKTVPCLVYICKLLDFFFELHFASSSTCRVYLSFLLICLQSIKIFRVWCHVCKLFCSFFFL